LRGWVDPRVHGTVEAPGKKFSLWPPGIDPGTHRFAAQRPNHYATPGPCFLPYLVFICEYHCTSTPYSFAHLSLTLCKLGNWQRL
jgi:hypothetical protein